MAEWHRFVDLIHRIARGYLLMLWWFATEL